VATLVAVPTATIILYSKQCYLDDYSRNKAVIGEYKSCSEISTCYDYKTSQSCEDNPCSILKIDMDECKWNSFSVEDELGDGFYLFGENMEGIHSIEYSNLESYFYIFGIRDNGIWLPWEKVEEYSYLLDLPTVPILFKGRVSSEKELKDITEALVLEGSSLGGEREGIVVRNAGEFSNDDFGINVIKWVRKNHIKTDSHWSRNWVKAKLKM
jgi:hypothetical protein